jgi:prepilin-type N-terminal cleavage/methylation domain-containing protein
MRIYKAFTLIELVLVISLIAILSSLTFVGLEPFKRIQDSNNLKRTSDINSMLVAIHQYIVDNKGAMPTGMSTSMAEAQLGTNASGCQISTGGCAVTTASCLNLATPLLKYLTPMPYDKNATTAATGYTVKVDANNIITVRACLAEGGSTISVTR